MQLCIPCLAQLDYEQQSKQTEAIQKRVIHTIYPCTYDMLYIRLGTGSLLVTQQPSDLKHSGVT